ncbi:helix-turn-helix domain-containing protein [soil metagenome]
MNFTSMTTEGLPSAAERLGLWRDFISKMIRNVGVDRINEGDFAARIAARRFGAVGCAKFWSRPHEVVGVRESMSNDGGSGYLVSWQLEGNANITVDDERFVLQPGQIAIIDGRRAMRVHFPGDVTRMVANIPAAALEARLPRLRRLKKLVLAPEGPFSATLRTYFEELSSGEFTIAAHDMHLIVDNICNLLRITSPDAFDESGGTRQMLCQVVLATIKARATDPDLSIDPIAVELGVSRRLVQKVLQEAGLTFTSTLMDARLESAAAQLLSLPNELVSAVAYRCGFNDVSHFNHSFKQKYGTSPKSYREKILRDDSGAELA